MQNRYQKIAEKFVKGHGKVLQDVNPSTKEVLAEMETSTEEDVKSYVERAVDMEKEWGALSPIKRGSILTKAGEIMETEAEEYSKLMTLEEGKPLKDSRLEVLRSFNTLKFYGSIALKFGGSTLPSANDRTSILTTREPLGTVAIISPWNFPLSIPVWKIAPALASGDTVIIKPASNTPLLVAKMMETFEKAGMPQGVVHLVVGSGKTVGNSLIKDNRIRAISFTGSVPVGKTIYAENGKKDSMTRVQLELGGKNAMFVDESADLTTSVNNAVSGAFGLTGQSCTATSRLLVHAKIYDRFIEKLKVAVENWKTGDGMTDGVNMGPVVDSSQYNTDVEYINYGIEDGAKAIIGKPPEDNKSLFLNPIIFENVTQDMRIFKEEVFGPVLGLTKVENLDEAINLANSVRYGHTSGIMTQNLSNAMEYMKRVDAGVIKINKPTVGLELQAPFGAFKSSGANTWKEMGEEAMEFYTREKTTYLSW